MRTPEKPFHEDWRARLALRKRIGRAVVETALPDPEFFAIWKVATMADHKLRSDARAHLKKMGSLQILLISNQQDVQSRNPAHWRAIEQHFYPDLGIARGFKEDLSDMPQMWQVALKDVLQLRADKEGVEYS